ncbi:MAG TPA: sigma-E factor regulatory protein RseB domain-containing protein [Frankiaceae bacterium]|nr:sigma-E factor regulatory protein RseB domain-containing protein [Frankiaceae bacterium]
MRRGPLLLATGGAVVLLHASAGAVPAQQAGHASREDALALLADAARAVRELTYSGTQMVSFWSESGSSSALIDVNHVRGQGLLLRVAPTPQNPGGAVYDDESGDVPQVVGIGGLDLLAAHYDVGVEGDGEVAGRAAYVVVVRRPGATANVSARFWIDRRTSLPLRREVLDDEGRTLRESAFIDVEVGEGDVPPSVRKVATTMPLMRGAPADVAALRAAGWEVPDRVGNGLELLDVRVDGTGDETTLHMTYSDGLATVSLFEQKGVLDTKNLDGWRRDEVAGERVWVQDAFPRRVVWAGRGSVFTVVADCPQATIEDLVRTLPHGTPGPGMTTRLGNGLARVGSWLNPFA